MIAPTAVSSEPGQSRIIKGRHSKIYRNRDREPVREPARALGNLMNKVKTLLDQT